MGKQWPGLLLLSPEPSDCCLSPDSRLAGDGGVPGGPAESVDSMLEKSL